MLARYSRARSSFSGAWLRYFSKRAFRSLLSPMGMAMPPTVMVSAEGSRRGISWPRTEAGGCLAGVGLLSVGMALGSG